MYIHSYTHISNMKALLETSLRKTRQYSRDFEHILDKATIQSQSQTNVSHTHTHNDVSSNSNGFIHKTIDTQTEISQSISTSYVNKSPSVFDSFFNTSPVKNASPTRTTESFEKIDLVSGEDFGCYIRNFMKEDLSDSIDLVDSFDRKNGKML